MKSTITLLVTSALTIAVPVSLFWWKFYCDARKRLDDRLIELEHELIYSNNRQQVFRDRYLRIRKAATDFERWMICPSRKTRLRKALSQFRGDNISDEDIHKLQGGPNEHTIDMLFTTKEARCLAPHENNFQEYVTRIAELRKVTGSREWKKSTNTTI